MSKHILCPVCGSRSEARFDDQGAFEVRGKLQGKQIRKCCKCNAGLAIGLFSGGLLGRPRVIPDRMWRRMESMWYEEFGKK